jgi:hypothetical protein
MTAGVGARAGRIVGGDARRPGQRVADGEPVDGAASICVSAEPRRSGVPADRTRPAARIARAEVTA